MLEKEIKILNVNKLSLIEKLTKLHASFLHEYEISGVYLRKDETKIRIRKEWDIVVVCFKWPKEYVDWIIVRQENEIIVNSYDDAIYFFEQLWYTICKTIKKYRTSYSLHDVRIDIDEYNDIPCLIELEWSDINEIRRVSNLLWYSSNDFVTLSYSELQKYYKKLHTN